MAVSFVARKCTQCAGRLKYIKEKKLWQCLYCGAEIEREEQYDGLFTIKNVVKQSLLDTAHRRLDSAAKNLLECEKIDSRYVGTLIAKLAYEMITVITPGACEEREVRNIFSQLKRNYEALRSISTSVSDEEDALYEFLEEADIFATLVLVYDSLNDTTRRDFVLQMLDAKQVYLPHSAGYGTYSLIVSYLVSILVYLIPFLMWKIIPKMKYALKETSTVKTWLFAAVSVVFVNKAIEIVLYCTRQFLINGFVWFESLFGDLCLLCIEAVWAAFLLKVFAERNKVSESDAA